MERHSSRKKLLTLWKKKPGCITQNLHSREIFLDCINKLILLFGCEVIFPGPAPKCTNDWTLLFFC